MVRLVIVGLQLPGSLFKGSLGIALFKHLVIFGWHRTQGREQLLHGRHAGFLTPFHLEILCGQHGLLFAFCHDTNEIAAPYHLDQAGNPCHGALVHRNELRRWAGRAHQPPV